MPGEVEQPARPGDVRARIHIQGSVPAQQRSQSRAHHARHGQGAGVAGRDRAAVAMRAAVPRQALFEHPHAGPGLEQIQRAGQADHAATHDQNVASGSIHPPILAAEPGVARTVWTLTRALSQVFHATH